MKKYIIISILFFIQFINAQPNYIRTIGTYYGDENMFLLDSKTDSEGNIIIVGNVTNSENTLQYSISTTNAHQGFFAGGLRDGFIAKFTTDGQIIWATYFGGEEEDIVTNCSIDYEDNILIIGHTKSTTGIATIDSFQPFKIGINDNYIAKLDKNGILIWSTYYGGIDEDESGLPNENENNYGFRGFSCIETNNNGEVFTVLNTRTSNGMATEGVFQEIINHDNYYMIAKFSASGERQWATFYGVNGSMIYGLQCDNDSVYVLGNAFDCPPNFSPNIYFATEGSYQPNPVTCLNTFISKFNSNDGTRIWSTYFGGLNRNHLYKNSFKLYKDCLYFVGITGSNTNITTSTSFQPTKDVGLSIFFTKFTTTTGQQVWGTYYGNSINNQTTRHVGINAFDDHLYIFGLTELQNNFTTPNSYQENFSGYRDGFVLKFTTDGERDWATYFGGWNEDRVDNVLFKDDALFLLGMAKSTQNISTPNGIQPSLLNNGSLEEGVPSNIFIAKLEPNVLSLQEHQLGKVSVFPNPSKGSFTIVIPSDTAASLEVYDVLGKKIFEEKVNNQQVIATDNWAKGIYLAKVTNEKTVYETVKLVVE